MDLVAGDNGRALAAHPCEEFFAIQLDDFKADRCKRAISVAGFNNIQSFRQQIIIEQQHPAIIGIAIAAIFNFSIPVSLVFPVSAVPLLISAQLFGDGFMTMSAIMAISLRQEVMRKDLLGRVNATFHLAESGSLVAGALLAAALVLWVPVEWVIWGATLGGVAAVPVLLSYRPSHEERH